MFDNNKVSCTGSMFEWRCNMNCKSNFKFSYSKLFMYLKGLISNLLILKVKIVQEVNRVRKDLILCI